MPGAGTVGWGRVGAAAVTAAFVGGLLGGAPAAHAAPPPQPDGPAAGSPDEDGQGERGLPPVWPRPQSMRERGPYVEAGQEAVLVADEEADAEALDVVREALRDAGVRRVHQIRPGRPLPARGLVVRVGTESAEGALRALRAPARGDLPSGGYRLATGAHGGRATVALEGAGEDGLFHAAQTLRQLVTDDTRGRGFPGVVVRDWPAAPVRGTTEGFYGQPWTHGDRLAQIDFLGRTKQNRFLYAPGDDPYRGAARWRDPYPAAQRADFRELAERAKRNHVTLGWAVSPGQGFCFSSADDRKALLRKVDAMKALGFGAFQVRFEDVSYSEWHCDEDSDTYGSGPEAAAKAQAELADALAEHLAKRHPDAEALSVVPTEFYQKGRTEYRAALADALDDRVQVAWSGVGVVPRTITGSELTHTREAFPRHPLVTMDNYPVNDYAQDRLFMGPYQGRDPAVASGSAALLTNAMEQPAASRIPLFTAADYAWNPKGYRPEASWRAAVEEAAGGRQADPGTRAAVHALAGNDSSSLLGGEESAYLRPLTDAFWTAYEGGEGPRLDHAARKLRAAFGTMRTAGEKVPPGLAREVRPWLRELGRLGEAGQRSVDMLTAQARGDGARAWTAEMDVRRLREESRKSDATVGKGVLADFADQALRASDEWTGLSSGDKKRGKKPGKPLRGEKTGRSHAPQRAGEGEGTGETGGGSRNSPNSPEAPRNEEDRAQGTQDGKTPKDGKRERPAGSSLPVRGGPDGLPGSPLSAAADGDPSTAYRAAGAPATRHFAPDSPPMLVPPSRADAASEGADGAPPALSVTLRSRRPLDAVTVRTGPHSGTRARVEAHVPGKGWQRLGALSDSGFTQLRGRGAAADALRLVWSDRSAAPVVHEVTPWYGDGPETRLTLPRPSVDADIGGGVARTHVRLTGHRPSDARGRVTADAPRGITVRAPLRTTVRRGSTVDVPVRVAVDDSVKPGTYRVPVSFGGERATLTVRAFPRTSGPDLARRATARSSADETEDFPAKAVNDGKRGTRWSSPARDGEWVQLRLSSGTRVGRVVLSWQDAYAKRYRVQVSPDGRRWRTAATVRDGEGGRESVRMDAPKDTRYVRIQGDARATKFGYSLYGVEVYAVDENDRRGENAHRADRPEKGRHARRAR
ncbi:beta-N-acetylglucosaminidase domain-containing protein [Streptomyces sp. NPDC048172]|uniref:beta-N-acetylglucosaminidase domain-containing protein n=1 Tax=Streptomyces sp. NPDC048172 TaxID=3365505 RepID=UPI0037184F01